MNKKIRLVGITVMLVVLLLTFTGCTRSVVDMTYNFTYGYVMLPNGKVVEGTVQSWTDFEDGDQLQVKIDGKTYLTHSTNVVLVAK